MSETKKEEKKKISLYEKWQNQMILIQEKTGVKGIYVVILLIICVFLVYLNIFDTVITNLLGTLYPAFWTIKSIENDDLKEQKNWLTYWAVFGSFVLIDMFSPVIVKIIPFYFVFKIIFLIMLFMPGSKVGPFIYGILVKKILGKYEDKIDNAFDQMDEILKHNNNDSNDNSSIKAKKLKLKNLKNMDIADAVKYAKEIDEKEKEEKEGKKE
jgi:receptor expression-enhancing protein 5/6